MKRLPYRSCCKRAAIQASDKGEFYLVSCDKCQSLFSITDDFDLLNARNNLIKMPQHF
jgi:hypothetical protein